MGIILCGFIGAIMMGWLFSLPVQIPAIRRTLLENPRQRIVAIVLFSLFTAMIMLWFSYYTIISMPVYNYISSSDLDAVTGTQISQSLSNELWQRLIMPPMMRQPCMTGNLNVCAIADEIKAQDTTSNSIQNWGNYLGIWLLTLTPAVVTGFFVYIFTRDNRKQNQG